MMSEDHKADTLEKIAVMQAYVDGKPIEVRRAIKWLSVDEPTWMWDIFQYRVATVPDSIDWDHVSPKWKYMARDENGLVYLYDAEPVYSDRTKDWTMSKCGRMSINADAFASLVKGTGDWKDSLVKRPRHGESDE